MTTKEILEIIKAGKGEIEYTYKNTASVLYPVNSDEFISVNIVTRKANIVTDKEVGFNDYEVEFKVLNVFDIDGSKVDLTAQEIEGIVIDEDILEDVMLYN